jgi:hypothetical protein
VPRISTTLVAVVLLALASGAPARADSTAFSHSTREILRIRLVNDRDGAISVSRDQGRSWQAVGRVLRYTTQVNRRAFTAGKWVHPGRVAATAVNAIHINAGHNPEADRGIVFSILPREFLTPPADYRSFLSPDASIYTDLPAGDAIFGGGNAPLVGSGVCLELSTGELLPLWDGYVPHRGDTLIITVARPEPYPVAAAFENREGGRVTLHYGDGSQQQIGWVIRPVRGIGRFAGSRYAAIGRVRANHAGVVDISTSPPPHLGAFQIIPVGHALSPEMGIAWRLTQWMIVGPAHDGSPLWDSLMPLFHQYLRPDYQADDLYRADWQERLLARFLVEIDTGGGWRPMPDLRLSPDAAAPLPEWAGSALARVERIRILFPLAERPHE